MANSPAPTSPLLRPLASPTGGELTVLTMHEAQCGLGDYDRRDAFKCVLVVKGANELHYASRSYLIDKPALVFTNRLVPFSWEPVAGTGAQEGYICAFTEPFLRAAMRGISLKESVLYRVDGDPVYYLDEEQLRYLTGIFGRMRRDFATDYAHREDLLRSQLSLVVHEAARLPPASPHPAVATNAAERVTNLFLDLLEIQFPVSRPYHEPILKNAQDFADRLALHVNSLNRAVKEVTGKPTTAHLAERFATEAKWLLHHTDWSVGDIADRLGFGYATYFHRFFKQHTGTTPLAFRQAA